MQQQEVRIEALHAYPIKSCAGIELREAQLTKTGFPHDRNWVLRTEDGTFISQRKPSARKMALVVPEILEDGLRVTAPGQFELIVPFKTERSEATLVPVKIWGYQCQGFDEGDVAAAWFSSYLGQELRLVHFDPSFERVIDPSWVGNDQARAAFQDGFPYLLSTQESLARLNEILIEAGGPAVALSRFRANIEVSGLSAFAEHDLAALTLPSRGVDLRMVKPCSRCGIVDVEQATGELGAPEKEQRPLHQLTQQHAMALRGQPKPVPIFGENVVVAAGEGQLLRVGDILQPIGKMP